MSDLDRILAELASLRDRLQESVDAAERIGLMGRCDELHREARELAPVSKGELQVQLKRLVVAWETLQRQRIDVVKQAGDLAAGNFGFTSDAVRLNQKIDEAGGRQELERRIALLRVRIAEFDG
ncbi:MAG: hypothetical protein V3V29_09185 [Acidimicrobiia bacterium]